MTTSSPRRLFVLRHGRSEANEQGRIAGSMANAGNAYGLTAEGRGQVREAVEGALVGPGPKTSIVSSPLLRARETAEIAAEILGASVRVDHRLIERSFGDFELASDDKYASVWELDRRDPTHRTWGVESVADVLTRLRSLLADLRATTGKDSADAAESLLLVTHGDVASTLICALTTEPLSRHRDVGGLRTGELRELDWPAATESPIFDGDS